MKHLSIWQYIWRMIRYAPWLAFFHAMGWTLAMVVGLVEGYVGSETIDRLSQNVHGVNIWFPVLALMAVAVSEGVITLATGFTELTMRFTTSGLVRRNLMRNLLQKPGAQALTLSIGETLNRFRDDAHAAEDSIDWTDESIMLVLLAIAVYIVLLFVDASLATLGLIPAMVITIGNIAFAPKLAALRERRREADSAVSSLIGDIMGGAQTLQLAGASDRAVARLHQENLARRSVTLKERVADQLLTGAVTHLHRIAIGWIMLLSADRIQQGSLSVGEFVLFITWFGTISDGFSNFGRWFVTMKQYAVSFRRMEQLIHPAPAGAITEHVPIYLQGIIPEPELIPTHHEQPLEKLELRNFTHRYETGGGVENISLTLPRGSITVITGRIGSGKSTLLQSLLGLRSGSTGEVLWNGNPITDLADYLTPPRAAYISQTPRLFSESIRNNILLGQHEDAARLQSAVHTAVLDPDLEALEQGLDTQIGTRGVKLSGGQVQRTAAARMLYSNAELLVIDDLTSALDVETTHQLLNRVMALGDKTLLLVTHHHEAMERADHILVLDEGRVVAEGTVPSLLKSSPEFRELWAKPEEVTHLE